MLVAAAATAADRVHQTAATAQDGQLRSACAASAQQILEGNLIRSALYEEQFSRYSPRTNRCYVELRVQTGELNERSDRFGRYLYDGETREMLAFAQIQNGKKSGKVFDLHHRTTSFENAGWDDASEELVCADEDVRHVSEYGSARAPDKDFLTLARSVPERTHDRTGVAPAWLRTGSSWPRADS